MTFKVHIRLHCVLFTDTSIVALEHICATLLIFSLALITGDKPLKLVFKENPQLRGRGAYQNAKESPLSRERFAAGDKERINDTEKGDSIAVFGWESSRFDFKLSYWIREYCQKTDSGLTRHAGFIWNQTRFSAW